MKNPDIAFHKWKNERKRGMISYMIRSSSLALFGLLVGHILAGFIYPSSARYLSSIQESAIYITIAIGVLIPTSLISWFLRERKYQNHLSKLKRT
ncbi:hypothetical protein [Aliivibrio sifiae]|uniref:hypothetical protein n=1 Tax=Aliivibrio sifiae TaxID=566293 RepID=UPI003D0DB35E